MVMAILWHIPPFSLRN